MLAVLAEHLAGSSIARSCAVRPGSTTSARGAAMRCSSGIRRALGPGRHRDRAAPGLDARPAEATAIAANDLLQRRRLTRAAPLRQVVDLARLLLDLLIVLAAAKLAAEVAERVGVPAVLGEIVAGIAHRPVGARPRRGRPADRGVSLAVIAEIGVLLLLVQVGMEMDLAELGRVGRTAMLVAVIGVAVPVRPRRRRRPPDSAKRPTSRSSSARP